MLSILLPLQVAEEPEPKTPMASQRLMAAGSLTGLGLSEELLRWKFTPTERAPTEHRAAPIVQRTPDASVDTPAGAHSPSLNSFLLFLAVIMHVPCPDTMATQMASLTVHWGP